LPFAQARGEGAALATAAALVAAALLWRWISAARTANP
jgi:hypothetical protein